MAALAMPSLSTTEAFAARTIRLLCCGLFSCVAMVHVRNSDAWVQLCCSAGRLLRAQLPPDSFAVHTEIRIAHSIHDSLRGAYRCIGRLFRG